jgi:hypothetical protein
MFPFWSLLITPCCSKSETKFNLPEMEVDTIDLPAPMDPVRDRLLLPPIKSELDMLKLMPSPSPSPNEPRESNPKVPELVIPIE